MPGTSEGAPRRLRLRWVAAALGAAVAAVTIVALAPSSSAATTVNAQLSLTGIATQGDILGGTTVGVHPGDTVNFEAAIVPTAGLDNIPTLGPLLNDLLTSLLHTQYQVVMHLPATFPGGARDVTVGGPASGVCKGLQALPVTFPNIGTYQFSWNVQYVLPGLLGGCTAKSLNNADLNLLKGIGVALNSTNRWLGQIVVATNPPPPGISVQLPGIGVNPSLPVLGNVGTVSIPNINLPTIPVDVPRIVSSIPGLGHSSSPSSTSPGQPGQSSVDCVPCTIVPNPGLGGGGAGGFPAPQAGQLTQIGAGLHEPSVQIPAPSGGNGNPAVTSTSTKKTVQTALNKAPSAQVPVVLAIIAIIALSLVTATYARLYLLRRGTA
jgi:hypothetical protein